MTHSNIEFASLELQRFWGTSKYDRDKLRANFGWRWCRQRPLRPSALRGSLVAPSQSPARHRCPRAPRPACPEARPSDLSGILQTCLTNLACNSPATISSFELTALKSQRFLALLNLHPIELHAKFSWCWCRLCPCSPRPGPELRSWPWLCGLTAPSMPVTVGVLHYMKPSSGVSPACRSLM